MHTWARWRLRGLMPGTYLGISTHCVMLSSASMCLTCHALLAYQQGMAVLMMSKAGYLPTNSMMLSDDSDPAG
jgi:hypothetical protein